MKGEKIVTNMLERLVTVERRNDDSDLVEDHVVVEVLNVYLADGKPEYSGKMIDYALSPNSVAFESSTKSREVHGKMITFRDDDITTVGAKFK
jgi:hypothetical protein